MFNKIERFVFNLVKKNATLKNILVKIYQRIFCIAGILKGKFITKLDYFVIENGFFGFHDRPSMNRNSKILNHEITIDGNAQISIFDLASKKQIVLTSTKCWNNQQGSLLTWFDDDHIIFNDFDKQPITRILNIDSGKEIKLPFHFFSISPDHKYVTSISFLRFGLGLKGYGYSIDYPEVYKVDSSFNKPSKGVSDLVLYKISSDGYNPVIIKNFEIQNLIKSSKKLIVDGYYYFSHSSFSPDSTKVYFLLRSSNAQYNSSQLFIYDLLTDVLTVPPTGGMVSHLSWFGNDEIIAYCNVLDGCDAYYKFHLNDAGCEYVKINVTSHDSDGHPNAIDNHIFITDTYPDRERRQHLYMVDLENRSTQKILSIYSPLKFRGDDRVDLHPRFSLCGNYITVDSSHNNKKQQVVLKIKG